MSRKQKAKLLRPEGAPKKARAPKAPKKPPLSPEERFQKMQINFVAGRLRRVSIYWPPIRKALDAAYAGRTVNRFSGREAKHYYCAHCLVAWPLSMVERDHIVPIGKKDTTWLWINRLLCKQENIQILCSGCHKIKTAKEKELGYE